MSDDEGKELAKTKDKKKSKNDPVIRRVKTKEDRQRPSVFMRLKTDQSFKAIALFEPDPELEDNPGYFEYYDHYDKQANQYVPCAGDKCPFCAANDNPSTRALTVWYFPDAGDVKDQVKVFTMNYSTIGDITDEAEEEDGILGKKIRIKRLSDKGDYKVRVLSDKPLSKSDLKKIMKALGEKFPDGLEGLVTVQLKKQLERLKALDALDDDDDDDDDDDEPKLSRKGKAVDDDEDEDDESDDEDEDDESDDEDEDDEDEESDDDEDEESEDDEDEESDDDDDEESEAEEISATEFEVVKIQEKDEIFDLKNEDGKFKMWLGEGVDVDYEVVKKGTSVTIDAQQDAEGDWIITAMKYKKPKSTKTKPKSSSKKDTKKGGKKK